VVNGKFVHEDVEYYLTRGENGASLYFNEFQKDVTAGNDWIQIEDGRFSLNGKTYTIDGDTIYVDAVVGFDNEYACRILNSDKFSLDGVDYVIEGDIIRYASVDDNRLIEIPIDGNGYGMYEPWRMEFRFDWT
jgi:ABC-type thiamine transport system substrate-binding protein